MREPATPDGRSGPALIIFDCDGVLVDSEVISAELEAEALAEVGLELTPAQVIERYVGLSHRDMVAAVEREIGRPLPPSFTEGGPTKLFDRFRADLRAIEGVAEAAEAVRLPRCVASSSSPERIRLSLEVTGLLGLFEPHIFSAHQVERGKPAPDLFLFAAERMGADPASCLVIEDSVAGVTGARAAGMTVLGFNGGSHADPALPDRLRAAGAHDVFSAMGRLPEVLSRVWPADPS